MEHHSEAFVALDTAKLRNAVAIADAGRNGEIRYLGEIDNTEAETRKLVAKLASKHARLLRSWPDRLRSLPLDQEHRP
jgi:hypothetical protein